MLEDRQREFAALHRITLEEYKKLVSSLTYDEVITCLELLKAVKHKSGFRATMEQHVRSWLANPAYLKPLSPNQMKAAKPKWPIRYNLPS